jgi:hypothetical protein
MHKVKDQLETGKKKVIEELEESQSQFVQILDVTGQGNAEVIMLAESRGSQIMTLEKRLQDEQQEKERVQAELQLSKARADQLQRSITDQTSQNL